MATSDSIVNESGLVNYFIICMLFTNLVLGFFVYYTSSTGLPIQTKIIPQSYIFIIGLINTTVTNLVSATQFGQFQAPNCAQSLFSFAGLACIGANITNPIYNLYGVNFILNIASMIINAGLLIGLAVALVLAIMFVLIPGFIVSINSSFAFMGTIFQLMDAALLTMTSVYVLPVIRKIFGIGNE